jgi:hypothetical protein
MTKSFNESLELMKSIVMESKDDMIVSDTSVNLNYTSDGSVITLQVFLKNKEA